MTVDKNSFTSLLHRYSGTSPEEAEAIVSLKDDYPFSQLLQTLAARVSRDHDFSNHPQLLEVAAIHAADRVVLKELITFRPAEVAAEAQPAAPDVAAPAEPIKPKIQSIEHIDYADEVMRDLSQLNSARHNFEMMFVEYSEVSAPAKVVPETDREPVVEAAPSKGKSKKERIRELAKAMAQQDSDKYQESGKKTGGRKMNHSDELIQEIQSSKQEITPDNDKQKEQIEIINQFIRIQPSISNSKDRTIPLTGDLNPIKSGEFGDNIVSETLVEILIKQGKKDKAIEVLKKLIWKYPQKKSYFASQIEDLKK
jgi:hypothetical protein